MSAVRPLPPRPNLEFEHKEAKAFLRRLRSGDPEALARARAQSSAIKSSTPDAIRLADAQLVIAREYGFASWPRLVNYYEALQRQSLNHGAVRYADRKHYDARVQGLVAQHRGRREVAARTLAAYVPRFFGMRSETVLSSDLTAQDAELAVARGAGFPSWDVLVEWCEHHAPRGGAELVDEPMRAASEAIEARDVSELERVVSANPDLLHPSGYDVAKGRSLLRLALHHERATGVAAMRPIMDWLAAQGLNVQQELNRQLCGHMYMKTDKVRWLIDRGADPSWIAPNGINVLEHALIIYWNGEAVDLVAARCKPRNALWIAAGLGDIDGVRRFLHANGKPTRDARRLRPDFDAIGPRGVLQHPDPDDEEILMEAFWVATVNGRDGVLKYMVSRGFPVNSLVWGTPVINVAAGNGWTSMVECLIECGADPTLTGWGTAHSARDVASEMLKQMPDDPNRRRIAELCQGAG